jgi:hypothetical protein
LLLVGVLLCFLWREDVREDRRHWVIANATTPMFAATIDEGGCHGTKLTTIEAGVRLPVQRIRYLKECAALDVQLPDGRIWYVVLLLGDVSVNPSLPKNLNTR